MFLSNDSLKNCTRLFGLSLFVVCATAESQQAVLEEIVVTAQKREQALNDVPIAVTVLSEDTLNAAGVANIRDAAKLAPVLEVQASTGAAATNYRIRRVGNLGNIPTFEPAVGVFVDGAFRQHTIFSATEFIDVERIEILRGPQSTLYGKNTTAGVIAISTAAPSDQVSASGEMTIGRVDGAKEEGLTEIRTSVSGPFSSSVRGSLSFSYADAGAWMDDAVVGAGEDANDNNRTAWRGQLAWDATDQLDFRLIVGSVEHENIKQYTSDLSFDPAGILSNLILPTWQSVGVSRVCTNNDPHDRTGCQLLAITSDLEAFETTLLTTYEFSNGLLLNSITSWDRFESLFVNDDAAQMMAPVLRFRDTWENDAFQQDIRLTSEGESSFDWQVGVFFYKGEFVRGDRGRTPMFLWDRFSDHPAVSGINQALLEAPFPVPFATQGQEGSLDSQLDTDYFGIYGQATWSVLDNFSVTGGVRYQEEDKSGFFRQTVNDPSPSLITLLFSPTIIGSDNLRRSSDDVTWSVSPQWYISEEAMAYATIASGWKSGGFNNGFGGVAIPDREFDDEDIMHYELGFKTDLLGNRMRVAASIFQTEYDNYQDAAFIGAQFTVGNARRAELNGAELEASVLLGEIWAADVSISHADFVYKENTNGQCYPGRLPDSPTDPTACDLSGSHPVNAPEWKAHLGASFELPTDWGSFSGRLDWSWTDKYQTSFSADPRLFQDAYSWVNFRLSATWENFEATMWVQNLTDEVVVDFDGVVNVYALPIDGSIQSFLQPPRSYGLTLKFMY